MKHSNQLIHETSPYLLQHSHNPVNWYAWKEEAFAKSRKENKPILVSIGYSTCHWCHVMERESFEDEQTAAYMNEYFINIKVDREERPDVDQIYMEAVQAISGSGGWPLNCFLTPEGKPFFGGTYYPPKPMYNRPSWPQVLQHIKKVFETQREVVEEQADKLVHHIKNASQTFVKSNINIDAPATVFTTELVDQLYQNLSQRFDRVDGGIGAAPKFPNTTALQFSLRYYFHTKDETAKEHALFSLQKMIRGGINDQLGGGFARYATDKAWLIPHFEKMLYDNALLVSILSDAFKLTQQDIYKEAIEETLEFIDREMTAEKPAFYAALDADSEGEEGKFYVWDKSEIDKILGEDSALFCAFYGVSASGNWEGKNILWRPQPYKSFAEEHSISVSNLKVQLKMSRAKLFKGRATRIRPGLDDKVLLNWNALQCIAYADAYAALGNEAYKERAVNNLHYLLSAFKKGEGLGLHHTLKFDGSGKEKKQYDAFLDDYAYLIKALLKVYQINFDLELLKLADSYMQFVMDYFYDKENRLFFYTSEDQKDIILRKKEVYDGATPSGNAVMAENLQLVSIFMDKTAFKDIAVNMLLSLVESIKKYPSSFGQWALALMNEVYPVAEVAVIGNQISELSNRVNELFIPNKIIMATDRYVQQFPLLAGKNIQEAPLIYLCSNYTCQKPVTTIEEFVQLMA